MAQLVEIPAGALEELLDLDDPRCCFPPVRTQSRRWWILAWRTKTMSSAEGQECGQPATCRVRVTCECMVQLGWACRAHLELLRHPRADLRCGSGHPAEVLFL